MQAEVAWVIQVVDGQIGGLSDLKCAYPVKAHDLGTACAGPANDLLDGDRVGTGLTFTVRPCAALCTCQGAVHQPGKVHFANHVGGLIGGSAIHANGDWRASELHQRGWCDTVRQARIALRAVRDAGAGFTEQANLTGCQVDQVG